MLEDKLVPVLGSLHAAKDTSPEERFGIVRAWFDEHEENLADDLADMAFVCTLPWEERALVTHPVMGNWYLEKMDSFTPGTEHQRQAFDMLRGLILETRFNNHHTKSFYDDRELYNGQIDAFNAVLLADPEGSMPIHDLLTDTLREVSTAVYAGLLPERKYTTDLGHGLVSPASAFQFLTFYLETFIQRNSTAPLDMTIMVVDDERPKEWYQRLITAGFKDLPYQQGFFFDCESALEALPNGRYEVILTDLELGPGKMSGMKFVERAYEIQRRQGVRPMISVFSYNTDLLEKAETKHRRGNDPKLFHQVNYDGNKTTFTATHFRLAVTYELLSRGIQPPHVMTPL